MRSTDIFLHFVEISFLRLSTFVVESINTVIKLLSMSLILTTQSMPPTYLIAITIVESLSMPFSSNVLASSSSINFLALYIIQTVFGSVTSKRSAMIYLSSLILVVELNPSLNLKCLLLPG